MNLILFSFVNRGSFFELLSINSEKVTVLPETIKKENGKFYGILMNVFKNK